MILDKLILPKLKQITLFLLLIFSSISYTQIIPQKLLPPEDVSINPSSPPKEGWVWAKGHWLWDNKKAKYLWVNGKYVKPKVDYNLIDGFWKPLPEGFQWVPGYWKKLDGHRYKLKGNKGKKVTPLFYKHKKEVIYID